jgi:hypothetical protein
MSVHFSPRRPPRPVPLWLDLLQIGGALFVDPFCWAVGIAAIVLLVRWAWSVSPGR